jgi:site-specific recombinase XerD
LTPDEIAAVSQSFLGKYAVRDKCLFLLGINIGARISELTALQVGDVWHHGKPVAVLTFRKGTVKGKKESYSIPLNATAKAVIAEMIHWKKARGEEIFPAAFLFASRKGKGRLSRVQVHRLLKAAFERAFLTGNVTTHSMRKTVANAVYSATNDLFVVKEILGHQNVSTTQQYLGVGIDKLQEAMDALSEGLGMDALDECNISSSAKTRRNTASTAPSASSWRSTTLWQKPNARVSLTRPSSLHRLRIRPSLTRRAGKEISKVVN